jgi:hypothetical protein
MPVSWWQEEVASTPEEVRRRHAANKASWEQAAGQYARELDETLAFLGDGGSMPIVFIVAATLMATPAGGELGWSALVPAVFIAGLPIIDTALVLVDREEGATETLNGYGVRLLSVFRASQFS